MTRQHTALKLSDHLFTGGLDPLLDREWLVTNGLGGYASGTVAGVNTRRYHGLCVVADPPPNARWVLVAGADLVLTHDGQDHPLSSQEYPDGVIHPAGFRHLAGFRLVGTRPIWRWQAAGWELEQTVWMPYGHDRTCIQFHNAGSAPVEITWRPFIAERWFHSLRALDAGIEASVAPDGLVARAASAGAPEVHIEARGWDVRRVDDWYRNFVRRRERERGFDAQEQLYAAADFAIALPPGQTATLQIARRGAPSLPDPEQSRVQLDARARRLAEPAASDLEGRLRLAADQVLVRRGPAMPGLVQPNTVVAGYPWFGDWGRDTMIALPGLCLATGRPETAKSILLHYARFISQGMLPNRWPDAGDDPEYTSVDAALWFLAALEAYVVATRDREILEVLATALVDIVDWHIRGTRHGIRVDPTDGLLAAGAEGLQLTWMDAKFGDWVVTPRRGKPVEVNALWCAGLAFAARSLSDIGWSGADYGALASRAHAAFGQRFWNPATQALFDVVDGPAGDDPTIRPNQIFAVAVGAGLLSADRARLVVAAVERDLLTPVGLRSLAPADPNYRPAYRGGPAERDGAYHQGPVWSWLLGPYVRAKLATGGSRAETAALLDGMSRHLQEGAVGCVSEIFQPEPPFEPDGAVAQAWGVAEWLRAVQAMQDAPDA